MYLCSWPSRELCESPTQLPKMLTHLPSSSLLHVLTPCTEVLLPTNWPSAPDWPLLCSGLTASLLRTDRFSAPDWLLRGLTPNWLTLFILLFRSRRFSRGQLFVWPSRQSWQRKVFWTLRRCFKDAGDKIPSLVTHPRTHTKIHIHTPKCTHTHLCIDIPTHI